MLIRIRRRDNKYQKTQIMKPAGIVAAACPDSTACYKGQKRVINLIIVGQHKNR
jgi:hypothetical protein